MRDESPRELVRLRPPVAAVFDRITRAKRWTGTETMTVLVEHYIADYPEFGPLTTDDSPAAAVPTPPEAGSGEKSPGSV